MLYGIVDGIRQSDSNQLSTCRILDQHATYPQTQLISIGPFHQIGSRTDQFDLAVGFRIKIQAVSGMPGVRKAIAGQQYQPVCCATDLVISQSPSGAISPSLVVWKWRIEPCGYGLLYISVPG